MKRKEIRLRLQSFGNGLLGPVPGTGGIERQLELDIAQYPQGSFPSFALGYALAVYPCIVGTGYGVYLAMKSSGLY